jgi:hypothetical protein
MLSDLDNKDSDSGNSDYQSSTPERLHLTQKVPRPLLLYNPHEDQLKRSDFKIIGSVNLMALMCTSPGKTCYFAIYILHLLVI